ncbi:MAG TPA: thiol reductant ABC exporter subunit CydC [Jiangellales bacterium]|nr:thiol reductant ABC exporter subunit CydC [Jiangellales bacterium]
MTPLLRVLAAGRPVRGRMLVAVLAGTAAAGSAVALLGTSAWLVSTAALQPPVLHLMVAIVAVRFFGISRGVLRYAERLVSHDAAFRILGELRVQLYRSLERLAPAGLPAFRSGDLLARLVGDVDTVQDLWLRLLIPYAVAAAVGGGTVIAVGLVLPSAAAVLAATLVAVAVVVPWLASRVTRRAEHRMAPLRGDLSTSTVDLLRAAPELVAYGAVEQHLAAVERRDRELAGAERSSAAGLGVGALLTTLAAGASVWAALALGVPAVRSGELPGVWLAVVVLLPLAVHEVVAAVVPAAAQLPRLRAAARRVVAVLDAPAPVAEPPRGYRQRVLAAPYGLRLTGLDARWPGTPADAPGVVGGLDLVVPPGSRVALVGPSGSGKSTLAAVLLRFLDPSAGTVELVGSDGSADLTALDPVRTRRVIGLAAQDAHVFDTTIEANVRIARREAGDDEVRAALARARLLDWALAQPRGLQTPVGEHGARLSGGQRQRLALARVLLADFPLLVVDEPTEHLDDATAAALARDLVDAAGDRTLVVLTHRPELFPGLDAVVPMPARVGTVGPGSRSAAGSPDAGDAFPDGSWGDGCVTTRPRTRT